MMRRLQRSFPGRVAVAYGESHAPTFAASLALNTVLAMFPMLLGIVTLLETFAHSDAAKQRFFGALVSVFPSQQHKAMLAALEGVHQNNGILGVVTLIWLFWAGTNLFASMELAFTEILGGKRRDALRERLMGFLMAVLFLLSILVAVIGTSAAATSVAGGVLDASVGGVCLVLLLGLVYRFVPNRTYTFPQLLPSALLVAVLVEAFSFAFPLYASLLKGFTVYGQQFALFFLIIIWIVALSHFLLLGAVFTRVRIGAPHRRGAASDPGSKGRPVRQPVQAERRQERRPKRR